MRGSPSLDAEIARVVFGALVVYDVKTERYWLALGSRTPEIEVLPYSTSEYSSEIVVKHYYDQGWSFSYRKDDNGFMAGFSRTDGSTYRSFRAETLPLATCIAALAIQNGTHIQNK